MNTRRFDNPQKLGEIYFKTPVPSTMFNLGNPSH